MVLFYKKELLARGDAQAALRKQERKRFFFVKRSKNFQSPGSYLASVGVMNLVQPEIGNLRRQHNAYMADGVPTSGEFMVDETQFTQFLDAVCDGWDAARAFR